MRRGLSVLLAIVLLFGLFAAPAVAAASSELETIIADTVEFLLRTVSEPEVGSVGGEWFVLGLARSGQHVPDSFFEAYHRRVEQYLRARNGVLDERRFSEYSRVILGLTAAGFDPRNVAGFDLTAPLGDFERTIWQGINGPIFALLALDSLGYSIPANQAAQTQATRGLYIAEILRQQLPDGGWNLVGTTGNADITGMALQALARYQHIPEVRAATERALSFLSGIQDANGGFPGGFSAGASTVESTVQVLVALGELGIPIDDPRFVKHGNTLLDNLLSFRNPDGGFRHSHAQSATNLMSTEQALYGFVAAQRAIEGRNSLYQMSDTIRRCSFAPFESIGLPGKHQDIRRMEVLVPGRTFADAQPHASRPAIEALASRGIITGRSETVFAPDETMTRAEFAAIITRAFGLPARTASVFYDVPPNLWFTAPVGTAFYYEIVNGTSATTFHPHGTITRQEAAVMVARAARLAGLDTTLGDAEVQNILAQFGDSHTAAPWARNGLAFLYHAGILDDFVSNIQPTTAILRGEIAEMLYRLLDRASLL
ncbi:MAG: S-layer homology domain-containing protein [Oscillospiraceae bacterium]|nr:S-layer homology domain-containing protein [Oscillospiraceae bacterium]